MTTNTRIYVVTNKATGQHRLVRAANSIQARNHVARESFGVLLASQDDLVRLVGSGQTVEAAGAPVNEGDDE
ncbi:MAG: hypothetical protein ACE15D_18920 [Candidatus Eisenbacteria bacterium]